MRRIVTVLAFLAVCGMCLAQRGEGRRFRRNRGSTDITVDRRGVPDWEV
ncbi:MAG: hypothetical protein JNK93_18155, partial [Planctomycetia bacterium]|nr:hypothetical protein [Planctomycetia bacterium]